MPQHLGDFPVNGKVALLWNTNGQDGASITRSTDGTLKIFKTNATAATWATERTSLAGVTQLEDFDATGMHSVYIDLSDNTDAGFYAAGNEYQVAIVGAVVDTKTVNVVLASFSIERAGGILALLKDGTSGLAALETLVDDLETRLGTPSNLGSGATVAANLVDIEAQTDDIGIAGVGLTAITTKTDALPTDPADESLIIAATDAIMTRLGAPAGASVSADVAGVPAAIGGRVAESQGSYTYDQILRIVLSVLAGVTSGSGATLKTPNGVATRVAATIDASNNRTAMTLTP